MSLPATQRAGAKPVTLKTYLADNNKELSALQNNPNELRTAARALLKGKGINQPTPSQLTETQFQLNEAIAQGTWQTFAPRYAPQAVKQEDSVEDRIGNIFFEKTIFSDADLQPGKLVLNKEEGKKEGDRYNLPAAVSPPGAALAPACLSVGMPTWPCPQGGQAFASNPFKSLGLVL